MNYIVQLQYPRGAAICERQIPETGPTGIMALGTGFPFEGWILTQLVRHHLMLGKGHKIRTALEDYCERAIWYTTLGLARFLCSWVCFSNVYVVDIYFTNANPILCSSMWSSATGAAKADTRPLVLM